MKAKTKAFDCMAMKREIHRVLRERTEGMTRAEEIAFFRQGAEEFEKRLQEARKQQKEAPAAE